MTAQAQPSEKVHQRQTTLRRRVLFAFVSYLSPVSLTAAFWWLGYVELQVFLTYTGIIIGLTGVFYLAIRSGFNLRFADPGMTVAQILCANAAGLYVMYYAHNARGVFLLLCFSAMMYGLFQLRTRTFLMLTACVLAAYGALIAALHILHPAQLTLEVEILQWFALGLSLLQFSTVGGTITSLRAKVKQKNRELDGRNKQLQGALARIEELAMRDELTGVFNRRYLMDTISREKQRSDRNGSTFCICIMDIDFFKNVNDKYGHLAGDEVLRQIAATASNSLRQTDFFGRYGGEEFACVLVDTPVEGAMITAERIRSEIAALRFPDMDPALRVTVSVGIADCGRSEHTGSTFKRADEALYCAKHKGRNQCKLAPRAAEEQSPA